MAELYEIAIRSPLRRLFTYESDGPLQPGTRVSVPFRKQKRVGIVWGKTQETPKGLRSIDSVLDEGPLFDARTLEFYHQSAQYYGLSLGDLLSFSLPKKIREGAPLLEFPLKHFVPSLPKLSEAQDSVLKEIQKSLPHAASANSGFSSHLLIGETGSGKTEIYLRLMEDILADGGQILFLVPEISLTPQLENRLSDRLGSPVSLFHSSLKESTRFESFCRAHQSGPDVFLGARSALFLPFRDLRLIVVDEEHDASYKQSERGAYHARDLALLRAKLFSIPIVLGSATPSLESYHRHQSTGAPIYKLPKFFKSESKPVVEIIDLKKEWKTSEKSFITPPLHSAIQETLEKGNQVLLFLNRRGSATQRLCVACGSGDECKNCSSSLTLHFDLQKAICHLCGFERPLRKSCESCGSQEFFVGGIGTKEVEVQIQERFPQARVGRLDRDQVRKRENLGKIVKEFAAGKLDILVGTQMISKGLDISRLSMVGVVLADQGWNVPDFRAMERAYQLLHQIQGRGGRRGQASRFVIQSFSKEHPLFQFLISESEENPWFAFAEQELKMREAAHLPPFSKYLLFTLADRSESSALEAATTLKSRIAALCKAQQIELLGPVPAPLARWKNEYRVQLLLRASRERSMTGFLQAVLDDLDKRPLGVKVRWDRDPLSFM